MQHGDCSFCDDMRRCIRSAPRNIAEGFGRYHHREFHQFLKVARGSLAEAQDGLIDARESKYIDQREFGDLWELSERAIKATTGLMRYLSGSNRRRDGTPNLPRQSWTSVTG